MASDGKTAVPRLSVKLPAPGAKAPASKKSPHVFAQVKKFYDVQVIYAMTLFTSAFLLLCCFYPFIGLYVCDTVREPAGWATFVYMWITATDFAPPLPFHVVRSYVIPMYLALLFFYAHPNGGDVAKGWETMTTELGAPIATVTSLGLSWGMFRFVSFCWLLLFTIFRAFGFAFGKSHTLAPGEKPRIIVASDGAYPSIHGVSTFNTSIAIRLQQEGYPLHIVTGSPAFEAKDQNQIAGAPCTRMPYLFTTAGPQTPLGLPHPVLLTRILLGFRPHVVHLLEPGSAMNIGFNVLCWLFSIPVVITHHTYTMEYRYTASNAHPLVSKYLLYLLYRTVLCLGDLHACVAKIMMDEKIDGVLGWSYPHIKVPNGIKPKFWITGSSENFDMKHRNAAMRDELSNGNPDAHLIVHVGRFSYEKKIMFLVPVIIELCKKYGDKVQFALVGWGPLLTPFCEAIANAGFADRIKAMNTLTGERLYQAYASSDIFFSPSCSEAFPIVFLEAMRSGLTCVAPCGPRAGGSQSTFKPGVHGYQYPRDDVAAAAKAVEQCIAAGTSMQEACLKKGRRHSWKRSLDQLLEFYDVVLRARSVLKDGKDQGKWPGDEMEDEE